MSKIIQIANQDELRKFLEQRPFALIHLDASWDGYRDVLTSKIDAVSHLHEDSVSFGYIDVDLFEEHARSINILNVPACSYYRGNHLVATVIGMKQDIEGNLETVRQGDVPDTSNTNSRL